MEDLSTTKYPFGANMISLFVSTSSEDPFVNPSSSSYLHSGENLGINLVPPQLNEINYHSWSRRMRHALLLKKKFKIVMVASRSL